jgi:hypothetical protein
MMIERLQQECSVNVEDVVKDFGKKKDWFEIKTHLEELADRREEEMIEYASQSRDPKTDRAMILAAKIISSVCLTRGNGDVNTGPNVGGALMNVLNRFRAIDMFPGRPILERSGSCKV